MRISADHTIQGGTVIFRGIAGDLRLGLRLARRHPGVALTTIVVMALGIGVATLAYAVHDALDRGLPVSEPDRMVTVTSTIPREGDLLAGVSVDDYQDFHAMQTTMDDLALWDAYEPMNLSTGDAPAERVTVTFATSSLHRLLGLRPLLGRLFAPGDDQEHAPRVAVLSEAFWQRRFGGDSSVIGRGVRLDGEPVTIVGVLPRRAGFENEDLFLALRTGPSTPGRRGQRPHYILARLRPGTTMRDANEEYRMLARRLSAAYPATNGGVSARVLGFAESRVGTSGSTRLLGLTGALILLIAIANVTNLFLVRASARERELHLRLALGANRWRVVRHFVGEAVIPVAAGAAGGILFAAETVDWFGGGSTVGWLQYRFEPVHGVFALSLAAVALVFIAAIPALQSIRGKSIPSLTAGAGDNTGRRFIRVGHGLVVAEIALGGASLFLAGLMTKTAINLARVDYGFAIEDVMTGTVQLDEVRYDTPEKRLAFWDTFRARAAAIPGVEAVALATQLPMIRYRGWTSFRLDGSPSADVEWLGANRSAVTPEFFDTFEKTLLQGRPFSEADGPDAEPVVIVNQDFVRKFFPDGRALGRRIMLGPRGSDRPWMRVVGIAPHMWMDTDVDRFPEGMYVPLAQHAPGYASVAIRVAGNPEDYGEPLRQVLMELDPDIPLDELRTMAGLIHDRTSLYRRVGPQYMFLGTAGLVLSMVGLYGIMAYMVRARTRELGIRMALGAQRATILRLVLRRGVIQIAWGIALGVGIALLTSRGISRLVFRMTPWDPWVLALSFGVLALTGIVATLVPARRASRVNPMVALRQ